MRPYDRREGKRKNAKRTQKDIENQKAAIKRSKENGTFRGYKPKRQNE